MCFHVDRNHLLGFEVGCIIVNEKTLTLIMAREFDQNMCEDYDQSDLLRQQLMPNIKVKVKLNANAVPTVPQNIPSTSNSTNLSKREKRKRSKEKNKLYLL